MSMNSYYAGRPVVEHLDYAAKEMAEAMQAALASIQRARAALATDFEPMRKLEEYPLAPMLRRGGYSKANLEYAYKESLPIVEKNASVIEHNLVLKQKLNALLTAVGLPTSKSVSTGRGFRAKTHRIDAGWLESLKEIPTHDPWPEFARQYRDALDRLTADEKKAEQDRLAKSQAAEKERLRFEAGAIAYSLCGTTDWHEAISTIVGKSKYLRLADAMRKTRSDWSDGCWRVSDALRDFAIETDDDRAMVTKLSAICADFDDGRSFRDCTWNYDRLFALVKEKEPDTFKVYEDLQKFEEIFA